ncbi:MAG: TIGR04222 domain-containing membrane protein [Micromonosporaceae bacterium]
MTSIAVPAATWGIPGPVFLWLYVGLGLVSLVAVLVLRHRALKGDREADPHYRLTPAEAAYLNGGEDRALAAALTALRAGDAIGADNGGRLKQTGPVPADATRLEQAVHHAIGENARRTGLPRHRSVRSELDSLESGLTRAGLLLSPENRDRARKAALWLLPVLGLGVIRMVAGAASGRPIGYLLVLVLLLGVTTIVLVAKRPRLQTPAGAKLLERTYAEHSALRPSLSPSMATYGAVGAGMAVALWGTSSLWREDPTFASAAGMRLSTGGSGTGYTGSSSSGCGSASGGSSCSGGGGGCGGGGCGG